MNILNYSLFEWITNFASIAKSRFFSLFDGSTNYISHPEWNPTSVDFEIEFKVRFDAGSLGVAQIILPNNLSPILRLDKRISDNLSFRYKTVESSSLIVLSGLTILADTDYLVKIVSSSSGVTLSAGGFSVSSTSVADPVSMQQLIIGAHKDGTSGFLGGRIWDVEYTDHIQPSNSRNYLINEPTGSTEVIDSLGDGSTDGVFIGVRNTVEG